MGEDRLALQQQVRHLRSQARQIERDLRERDVVQEGGVVLARSLLAEAEQVGLLPPATTDETPPAALLATIVDQAAVATFPVPGDAVGRLRDERTRLLARHGRVKSEIAALDIISHLALHQYLVHNKRPVPRFLVLDQPTQVYYPPDQDPEEAFDVLKDEDREAIRRLFRLIFDVVESLSPHFQVIILDHADVDEPWFQSAVVEKWRGGDALVPSHW